MKYQESHLYAHEVRMNGMEKILRSYGVAQWTIDEARGLGVEAMRTLLVQYVPPRASMIGT